MLYASLVGPLLGLYYPLPFDNPILARLALNASPLRNLWGSVYTPSEVNKMIADSGGIRLESYTQYDHYVRFVDQLDQPFIDSYDGVELK